MKELLEALEAKLGEVAQKTLGKRLEYLAQRKFIPFKVFRIRRLAKALSEVKAALAQK